MALTIGLLVGSFALNAADGPTTPAAPAKAADPGVLEIYDMSTQIGTSAKRTFTDDQGRVTKEIYYSGGGMLSKATESQLRPQSTQIHFYDGNSPLRTKTEIYNGAMQLSRIFHYTYDAAGRMTDDLKTSATGVKEYEIRYFFPTAAPRREPTQGFNSPGRGALSPLGRETTHIHYDDAGAFPIKLRGRIPPDRDLPHGWGNATGGLACGIGLSRERGPVAGMELTVNIKNVDISPFTIANPLPLPKIIVHDSAGKEVQEESAASTVAAPERVHTVYGSGLNAGDSAYLYPAYALPKLAPGRYTVRVRQTIPAANVKVRPNAKPVVEKDLILESNAIAIVVE